MKASEVRFISTFVILFLSLNVRGQSLNLFLKQHELKIDTTYSSFNDKFIPKISISNYPLFCKWEELLQAQTKIAVRFRLGNLETANKFEGK